MTTGFACFIQRFSELPLRFIYGYMIYMLSGSIALAQTDEFPLHIDGDIGIGSYYTRSSIRGKTNPASVLPYGNFDYNRMFVRIDTLGVKIMKMGYGYLEIAGRFSQDGFDADELNLHGLNNRQTSIPLGLGTLQVTPVGAFFINAFHDINQSRGNLFEVIYVAELGASPVTFYPMIGAEYQSSEYVRYYFGISPQESAASQYAAYQPAGTLNPLLGMMIDAEITKEYHLNLYLRRKWLGNAIQSSPIVARGTMDNGFIALSYRFE